MLDLLFRGDVEGTRLILSAAFLVTGPFVGWICFRVLKRVLDRRRTGSPWGVDEIVLKVFHDISLWWFSIAGTFAALQTIRYHAAVRIGDAVVVPARPGLRTPIAEGIERFLVGVLILSATIVIARAVGNTIRLYSFRSQGTTRSSSVFVVIAHGVVYIVGALVLMQTFGLRIGPLLGALGVGGLAVALAMQDTLSNFFAGLQLLATKKVKPGDYVQLESGQEGYVVDIDWRHTSIRQLPNNMLLVPNAKLADSIVTNYYYPQAEMSVLVQVGVAYESDLEHVERVTVDVAREVLRTVDGGVDSFDPFVRYHTFGDSSIDFTVILRAHEVTDQFLVKHEFVKRLKSRFDREGIVIPFPIRTIDWPQHQGDGVDGSQSKTRATG